MSQTILAGGSEQQKLDLLPKLCTPEYGAILRFDSNSGLFSFSDPIYRAYAIAQFHQGGGGIPTTDTQSALERTLLRLLSERLKGIDTPRFAISFKSVAVKK